MGMTETAILKTAAHELTHFIQANSAQYEALKSFVVNKLTHEEGVSFEDLVADKQRREPGLEYDEAVDEVVADACEMMLGDSTVVEQLAKENRSLAEKIRDWLREWVENLKIALEGLQADRTESRTMMQYARELQEIWDNALMDAARNNRGTSREAAPAESRRQVRENFSNEIDSWVKDDMPEGVRFTLGSTGPVLQGLGAIESDIYMEGDKIKKIMQDHPEMTLAEIKKVPQILEDPAMVLKSKTRTNSLVVLGTYQAQNGRPILAAMDLLPRGKGFVVDGMQKVTSAYTKTESQTATAEQVGRKFLMGSDVLFAGKKRAIPLLRTTGLTISSQRLLRNGYIGSISYKGGSVNIHGVPFSSVVKIEMEDKAQNQPRDPRLSDRDVLRMAADMAQRDRSQRWSVTDLNRFDLLQRKLLQLDEANAELEALKEERKVLLAGRKVKELTRDEQFELAQNRNRTETQKGKMFVNRIQRVARNNIS